MPHEWPGIWNPAVAVLKKVEEGGAVYEGAISFAGNKSGPVKISYKDCSLYEWNFIEGLKHGQGIQRYSDGSIYEGFWENDL